MRHASRLLTIFAAAGAALVAIPATAAAEDVANLALSATLTSSGGTDEDLEFVFRIDSSGPQATSGSQTRITPPPAARVLTISTTSGTCVLEPAPVCTHGAIAPGDIHTITLKLRQAVAGTHVLAADITGTTADPTPADRRAEAVFTTVAPTVQVDVDALPSGPLDTRVPRVRAVPASMQRSRVASGRLPLTLTANEAVRGTVTLRLASGSKAVLGRIPARRERSGRWTAVMTITATGRKALASAGVKPRVTIEFRATDRAGNLMVYSREFPLV